MTGEVRITQTGRYLPSQIVTNHDLAEMVDTSDEWISSRTGIHERRIVQNENSSDLAAKTAELILEKAQLKATDLDCLIVATMTPDANTPSTACLVQGKIGATNAFAFDISAACSGFVYALSVGQKLLSAGNASRCLVIGVEVMSKIVDWQDRATCVLFGDGAGGVLLEKTEGQKQFLGEVLAADGAQGSALTADRAPARNPFQANPTEQISDPLQMNGREIFMFALNTVTKNIQQVCEQQGIDLAMVDYLLPHQANTRIFDGMAKKLKYPRERFLSNVASYGNTSAASIPILLDEALEAGTLALGSQQKVVLTGFGGGLTWGSILLSL